MNLNLQSKILVIEDDCRLSKTIKNLLMHYGYDICCAENGAIGIQKAFEYNPDLILCDIHMNPVDGYQVYHVLKESSILDHVPFIFITGNSDLQDIRFGMDLGADDYFVKPFDNERLIRAVEKRLTKYRKLKEVGRSEFNALFNLSPDGIFLFDGQVIFDANHAFIDFLKINKEILTSYSLEDFIEADSYKIIKENISMCSNGLLNSFSDTVCMVSKEGKEIEVSLYVSVYEKYSGYALMIGLVTLNSSKNAKNDVFISDFLKVLKRENVKVSDRLGEKLAEVFTKYNIKIDRNINTFFSQREYEVLCLSMEGQPIKTIADKLYISDRTVEKHRANLMEKTNSNNMIEVIIYALRNNLVKM